MNRRKFIKSTSGAMAVAASVTDKIVAAPGFSMLFFQTNWGFNGTLDEFCAKTKLAGYDGVELWWPGKLEEQKELFDALKKHKLAIGFLCGSSESDPKVHLENFKKQVIAAVNNGFQKPIYINCHSGKDFFKPEENQLFIDFTTLTSKAGSIPIYHETHRGRMLFAAHTTKDFLQKNIDLRLTLDISHWCNVHESLLQNQPEAVKIALDRTGHIHTRVGHEEGPQVNDPRAPEWKEAFDTHLAWWDKVVALKKQKGEQLTLLTEFGPPSYMPTLPFTNQPVADQWGINVYMMQMLKKRYL
jgi:sugar phosphate isomerase/epimerase